MTEPPVSIPQKVLEYEKFLNETLRDDLRKVEQQAENVCDELASYLQIAAFVKQVQAKRFGDGQLKLQTDIGCNFYVQCTV